MPKLNGKACIASFLAILGLLGSALPQAALAASDQSGTARGVLVRDASGDTTTPIKHVIVIIGENHTYDNVFGTYQPVRGQSAKNLLSEGIVTPVGDLAHGASKAAQKTATDTKTYNLKPEKTGKYQTLPQPNTTYAQGQPQNVPDTRFPANLPNGPYQITKYVPYQNSYVGDPSIVSTRCGSNRMVVRPIFTRGYIRPPVTTMVQIHQSRLIRARSRWAIII
ncbi:hypothetical protein KDW_49370 [Dictyobacter vulcani]|uniref:Phosphoesterase n=1 Tax=Dictyobacter vulcani TaxID=2607529 RepID=A0A5J4KS98_9CHLR|nr:hypothetical protein KDW_49370 [Dictyobacter vulcani]